jgi:hypothetical protein
MKVMLDVFQERHPYYYASASVISKVLNKEITGLLPSHAITTIQYITSKYSGKQKADETIDWMLILQRLTKIRLLEQEKWESVTLKTVSLRVYLN